MPSKQRKVAMMGYRSVVTEAFYKYLSRAEDELLCEFPTAEIVMMGVFNRYHIDWLGFRVTDFTGKSSLIIQYVEGQFVDSYDPTIENTFTKFIRHNSTDYEVKLVDTAGQDEYSIFPAQYSMDFHGYVLVYSITSNKSFQIVQVIYDKLLDMVGKVHVPIVLVGNKTDLHMERKISTDEGKRLAEKWKAAFVETSAKQNESVTDMFQSILVEIERADGNLQEKNGCYLS